MHCKPPKLKVKQQHMASLSTGGGSVGGGGGGGGAAEDDGDGSRSGKSVTLGHSPGSYAAKSSQNTNNNNNNNDASTTNHNNSNKNSNNNNDNSTSSNNNNTSLDSAQIQLKKQALEQRKQELEKLLSEKSWLLQQLQKQETQILNGNYEYLNLNDIFGTLQQCKQDATGSSSVDGDSAILRRKTVSASVRSTAKENLNNNNNNNNSATQSNRHSEISNRSSEYDNYPGEQQVAAPQLPAGVGVGVLKVAQKKRANVSNWQGTNTLPHTQQQLQQQQQQLHKLQQQQQQHQQQLRQHYLAQMTEQQHFQYTQQQVLQHQQQQQQQQQHRLQHQHFHPRQQLITAYHSPTLPPQAVDAISLYSANSANVATLRTQPPAHLAQIQTPIMVQCDKYYLSPTHQSYNDGGFIKSSQNIKQYISPQPSPTTTATLLKPLQPLQLQQQHLLVNNRAYDGISLSPSYAANMEQQMTTTNNNSNHLDPTEHYNNNNTTSNLRWRSQSSVATKNHSSDTLNTPSPNSYYTAAAIPKHMDEISIASFGSETQKKQKPKQWLESSLDGPVIRSTNNNSPVSQQPPRPHQAKPTQQHNMHRDRARLSSQSMSSGAQRYNGVAQRAKTTRLLQDDDGKYAKLSQSTSYLNNMDALAVNTNFFPESLTATHVAAVPSPLPARSELGYNFMSPKGARLLPASAAGGIGVGITAAVAADKPALSPEIRIESPKNMTIVQQATFQPYKEITKPFEMSDFYKYSTKFKQKEVTTTATTSSSRVDAAQEK